MKTFKKYLYLLLCLPALFISCSDSDPDPVPDEQIKGEITISTDAPTFTTEAGTQEIEFSSTSKWTVRADQSWCTVQPTSGNAGKHRLRITVVANDTYDERNSSIIFKAGTNEKRMTITQKQKNALLLTAAKAEINADAQDVSIEVKANVNYEVTVDAKAAEWIVASKSRALTTKKHTFSIKENKGKEKREGKIVFKSDEFSETFTVYQEEAEEPTIVLSKDEYIVSSDQNEVAIELKSNTEFKMIVPEVDWLRENTSRAMSTYTRYITVDANTTHDSRSAEIEFVYGEKSEKVKIIQQQKDAIVLSKSEYEMESDGGKLDFVVASNVDYEVKTSVEWIKEAPKTKGLEEKELNFIVEKNPTTEVRKGEIVFKSDKVEQKVTVTQKAMVVGEVKFLNELKAFETKGGSQELKINASLDWTVETKQDWCTVTPTSGKPGESTLTITVTENTTNDERNAALTFKSGDSEKKLTIVQKQKDALLLSSAKAEVQAVGDTLSVEVKSNVTYEVTIDEAAASWITQVETRAMTTKTYNFKVAQNTTYEAREGSITFTGNGLTEVYKVYQEAAEKPELVLNQKEYVLDYKKTDVKVELKSNTEYEMIVPSVDWLHEDKTRAMSDYTHYFTVDENTTTEERKAEIKFVYAGQTEVVTVIQKQKDIIILSTDTCKVAAKGGEIVFDLQTKNKFEVEIGAEWIKRVELTGEEATKKLKFTVEENLAEEDRVTEITLKNAQVTQKIVVSQKGQIIPDEIDFLTDLKTFVSGAQSQELKIKASKAWTATPEQTWCKVTPASGKAGEQVVKVEVDANSTYDERNSAITFKVGELEKKVTITQKQLDAVILTAAKKEVKAAGEDITVEVKSNVEVTYTIDSATAAWVSAVAARGLETTIFQFKVAENTRADQREGYIVFEGGGKSDTLTIYQPAGAEPQLVLTKKAYEVGAAGETIKIELQSNANFTMELPTEATWIHEEVTRALSSYTRYIKVDANTTNEERTAVVKFNYAGKTETVTIKQVQNNAILVKQDKIEVEAAGGPISFDVEANVELEVEISDTWIKQTVESRAMTTKTLNFAVDENTSEEARTATIKVSGGGMEATVTVTQKGKEVVKTEFSMVHSNKTCVVPTFTGSKAVAGTIDWGDSKTEAYKANLKHTYGATGDHTLKATLQHAEKVEIKEIEGIKSIDLSKF